MYLGELSEDFPSDFVGPLQPGDTRSLPDIIGATIDSWLGSGPVTPAQKAQTAADVASAQQRVTSAPPAGDYVASAGQAYQQWQALPPQTAAQKAQVASDVASASSRVIESGVGGRPASIFSAAGIGGMSWTTVALLGGAAVVGFMMMRGGFGKVRKGHKGRSRSKSRRKSSRRRRG